MGLSFGKLECVRPATESDLYTKTVAIDVPNLAYPFYTVALQQGADRERAVLFAMRGVAQRVLQLGTIAAKSILVLDGPPHPLKADTLADRARDREARGVTPLTGSDYVPLEEVAEALGVPLVRAVHDAEAQCAHFCDQGLADVVATTDWDALIMGARVVLRGLSSQPDRWTVATRFDVLRELQANDIEVLAAAAVLMGCDYSPGIAGVGPKKALKIARDCAGALERSDIASDVLPDCLPNWRAAMTALTAPEVTTPDIDWFRPDPVEVVQDLLDTLGARPNRQQLARELAMLSILHEPPRASSPPPAPGAQATLGRFT